MINDKKYRVWNQNDFMFDYFADKESAELKANNDENIISKLIGKDKNDKDIYTHDVVMTIEGELVVHGIDGEEIILLKYQDKIIPERIFIKSCKNKITRVGSLFEK